VSSIVIRDRVKHENCTHGAKSGAERSRLQHIRPRDEAIQISPEVSQNAPNPDFARRACENSVGTVGNNNIFSRLSS